MIAAAQYSLWAALGLIAFAYVGYPTAIFALSRLFGRRPVALPLNHDRVPRVSVLVSALNEEEVIAERIENNLAQDYPAERLEIVIASDGSTDRTAEIVGEFEAQYPGRVKLVDYSVRRGKATAVNETLPQVAGDIVVLSDANTMFAKDAISKLARWFADDSIGVVCGKLKLVDSASGKNVDGLYWRYETFLKECEGRLGALLGSNGAIYALRRQDFVPIPPDTIIDDFMIPLLVKIRRGKRIVYDTEAIAHEETAPDVRAEFRRRARIGAGGFQSLFRLSRLALPIYGWTSFAFLSHKVLRWLCPFLLIAALIANLFLLTQPVYQVVFALQVAFYLVAVAGVFLPGNYAAARLVRLTTMFTSMNLALAVGFWRWVAGKQRGTWQRTAR
ncbi:MAG TPA: glycosyltransferase family 2 protein [Pirellulaceae bacterium]|nr:glycosyltransferase family 2 protein [Pirellulaceae bacterium]